MRGTLVRLSTLILILVLGSALPAGAEVNQLRISRGFGVHYLPLYVMETKGLLQKHYFSCPHAVWISLCESCQQNG